MDTTLATPLLGGLSPQRFMRRHWQKRPLLVRAAVPDAGEVLGRAQLFALAAEEGAESRLIVRDKGRWTMRHGPIARRALPPLAQAGWTLLVQGVELHLAAARELLDRFRFVPDARLDDLMVSYASEGGSVGPHVDSYDVFLLQLRGKRRWRIGPVRDAVLVPDVPLKLLDRFEPVEEWLLDTGDMLYLPPGWAHDGVAQGECLTASIGFRAPGREALAREILQRAIDAADADEPGTLYRDAAQAATDRPAQVPAALAAFGTRAVARLLGDTEALACALGEVLSEPKPGVWFEAPAAPPDVEVAQGVRLASRSRMLYDERFVFLNGESFRATGRDARLMRELADRRRLPAPQVRQLGRDARRLLGDWLTTGWLVAEVDISPDSKDPT